MGALPDGVDARLLAVIEQTPSIVEHKLVTRDFSLPWASARPKPSTLNPERFGGALVLCNKPK
jgi:hypothetical protein